MGNWFLQFLGKTVKSGLSGGLSKHRVKHCQLRLRKGNQSVPVCWPEVLLP